MPTRASLRVMGVAAKALLRTISKVAGTEIVRDAVTFFQAFDGMEEGFRNRAVHVRELLGRPSTAFVPVASPRPDSVEEAVHFADKLVESDLSATALIVNRVQPRFADGDLLERLDDVSTGTAGALADLVENLRGYTAASDREEKVYRDLVARVAPAPVTTVPLLNSDVHDLGGLATIADLLFPGPTVDSSPPVAATTRSGRAILCEVRTILVASDAPVGAGGDRRRRHPPRRGGRRGPDPAPPC